MIHGAESTEPFPIPKPGDRPPLPRLTLRVGVVGHRPNKLGSANLAKLKDSIVSALSQAEAPVQAVWTGHAQAFAEGGPRFRLVSALAEGADRLVAGAALERGYELHCPLPFPREAYAADFPQGESRNEYYELLNRASAVFELDGVRGGREQEAEAYLAVGRLLVRQCDVLIAIWDGLPAAGPGGTAEIVAEAIALGVPVLHIDSQPPHTIAYRPPGLSALRPRENAVRPVRSACRRSLSGLRRPKVPHAESSDFRLPHEARGRWPFEVFQKNFRGRRQISGQDLPSGRLAVLHLGRPARNCLRGAES